MDRRYVRNIPALSEQECDLLSKKRVCVVGCGGLGGYIVEMLARVGVGSITVIDGDVFSETNLNRQLFSTEDNLGSAKVQAAFDRIRAVNSAVELIRVAEPLNDINAAKLLKGHDTAVDALDNIPDRLLLAKHCRLLSIPLVHGAIGGWYGQVTTILPKDNSMALIYQDMSPDEQENPEMARGSLAFAAAATASAQCGEVVKLLTGKGSLLTSRLLWIDLLEQEYTILDLS